MSSVDRRPDPDTPPGDYESVPGRHADTGKRTPGDTCRLWEAFPLPLETFASVSVRDSVSRVVSDK